jgi:hypothetical protein
MDTGCKSAKRSWTLGIMSAAAAMAAACIGLGACQTAASPGSPVAGATVPVSAPATPAANAEAAVPAGRRLVYASHSLMWDIPKILDEEVKAYGIKNHALVGLQSNGFSNTTAMWNGGAQQSRKWLETGEVDDLVNSPMEMPDAGVDKYVELCLSKNPKMRIFLQNNWAGFNMDGNLAGKLMGRGAKQWDQSTEADLQTLNTTCEKAFEDQVKKINEKYKADEKVGREVIFIIPTSQANTELRTLIIQKKFPGLDKQSDLFQDQIGHPKPPLWTLNSYMHFACIYGKSPVGLPMPAVLKNAKNPKFDEDFNKRLQELAWKTVTSYPLSGVKASAEAKQ